jgi:sec-independent protein translocase protein TatB
VFGFSFSEVLLIGVVTLVAVGPQRLPGMLRNFGTWMRKLRKMTTEVRQQTGIDEMLRAEGLHGGLNELRSLMRGGGGVPAPAPMPQRPVEDPYGGIEFDVTQEYPPEGPDALGALPDDLAADAPLPAAAAVTTPELAVPVPSAEPAVPPPSSAAPASPKP